MILAKSYRAKKQLALLAVAFFASILCWFGYTFSRSDSLMLTFYAACIYVVTKPVKSNDFFKPLILALLSVACILSKQNGITVPIVIIVWLFIKNARKTAIYYSIFFLILFVGVLSIYNSIYPHLFENTVMALRNRIDFPWFYTYIFKKMMDSIWALPLYFSFILAIRQWIKPATEDDRPLGAIFILQAVFSLAFSLKLGSGIGYFNESVFIGFIILTRKLANTQSINAFAFGKKAIAWTLPLIILFSIHTLLQGYLLFIKDQEEKKVMYNEQKEIRDYLRPKLQGRYVLNMTNPNTHFFKTLLYREIAVPNIDIVDCCTMPDEIFDYSSLKKDISNGKINFLITDDKTNVKELWNISLSHFSIDTVIHGYTIYKYKQE
ncbi:MAG: hypothetical protein WDN26_20815 [Chitinophagaceae bacterium]